MPVLSLISHETDEHGFVNSYVYKTERGYELTIKPTATGLWQIVPKSGGKHPRICEDFFTSHLTAQKELIKYLETTDNLGYAEWPGKEPRKSRMKEANGAGQSE